MLRTHTIQKIDTAAAELELLLPLASDDPAKYLSKVEQDTDALIRLLEDGIKKNTLNEADRAVRKIAKRVVTTLQRTREILIENKRDVTAIDAFINAHST